MVVTESELGVKILLIGLCQGSGEGLTMSSEMSEMKVWTYLKLPLLLLLKALLHLALPEVKK